MREGMFDDSGYEFEEEEYFENCETCCHHEYEVIIDGQLWSFCNIIGCNYKEIEND